MQRTIKHQVKHQRMKHSQNFHSMTEDQPIQFQHQRWKMLQSNNTMAFSLFTCNNLTNK